MPIGSKSPADDRLKPLVRSLRVDEAWPEHQ